MTHQFDELRMNYFCLSFEYKFEHSDDEVFFAYTLPYTYTQMQRHLIAMNQLKELKGNNRGNILMDHLEHKMFEITSLGKSNG